MYLTKCAVCATELGLTLGKKCGRCSTRYCGPVCQKKHWEEGGHDQLCKKIKKAGGAEQFHANTKYTEAVAVAAEKCAEDTISQQLRDVPCPATALGRSQVTAASNDARGATRSRRES